MNARRRLPDYPRRMSEVAIDLMAYERPLLARGEIVVGIDEVGRGALAGPVTVGAAVLSLDNAPPVGLTDSKALTKEQRESLVTPIESWVADWSLGSASASEIDAWGLRLALAVAATRALAGLRVMPTYALIDGNFNLLDAPVVLTDEAHRPPELRFATLAHTTVIKGDRFSGTVAAASVLAKVHRDRFMARLASDFPVYGWDANKGYGAPQHLSALVEEGPCTHHRQTWHLPARRGDFSAVD
jgi:ribonuclease HII